MPVDNVTLQMLRQPLLGRGRDDGAHAAAHRPLDLRARERGLHHRYRDATRWQDFRLALRTRRDLVRGTGLRATRSPSSTSTTKATSASPTTPTAASCALTPRTCTCGNRSSTRASCCASSPATSTTPTSGGAVPASLSRTLTEVHQEGIRIPPTKLYRRGELNRGTAQRILLIERAHAGTELGRSQGPGGGDEHRRAQGSRDCPALRGRDLPRGRGGSPRSTPSSQARNVIRKIPDGEYFFADYMDEDTEGGYPARIALNLVVDGEEITFDYYRQRSRSSPPRSTSPPAGTSATC